MQLWVDYNCIVLLITHTFHPVCCPKCSCPIDEIADGVISNYIVEDCIASICSHISVP